MKIYIIHENDQWFEPLAAALSEAGLPFESWHMEHGRVDLSEPPPLGLFFSRMSASSHTRGHRFAPEYTSVLLPWLETYGRRVINGSGVLRFEINKMYQYAKLKETGIPFPRTAAAFGRDEILGVAEKFPAPFIVKPNRGGRGAGVQLFQSHALLKAFVESDGYEEPVDGITLIQEYIRAVEPYITRLEFIGGEFFYAVKVDTSKGFELCPADACQVETPAAIGEFCAFDASTGLFTILKPYEHPLIGPVKQFLHNHRMEVAGVEFVTDTNGNPYVYDINTNTNYNSAAESKAGVQAMPVLAEFLGRELKQVKSC